MTTDSLDQKSRLDELARHFMEYLDTRWDLIVLAITERGMAAASSVITGLLLAFFGGIALVFASIGAAIWIGRNLDNPAAGYFVMAGVFLVILVLALVFARNYLRTVVTDSVLEAIKDDDDETTS